jgi:hypothetical protein
MKFYVEGENGKATVRLEMTKAYSYCSNYELMVRESMIINTNIDTCLSNLILVSLIIDFG